MPNAKRMPPAISDAAEARIQAGIANDPDNPEITEAEFARMRPAAEVLPTGLYAALTRPRGRPKAAETKQPIKLRLDRAAIAAFKGTGPGWMTRISDVIADAAKSLPSKPKARERAEAKTTKITPAKAAAKKTGGGRARRGS